MVLSGVLVLVLLGGVFFYLIWTPGPPATEPYDPVKELDEPLWPAPEFELINSQGEAVADEDLQGQVWLAAFIFTRCPGPCPLISRRMEELQERVGDLADFRMVSFSVDPEFDRPEVLREYARQWNADTDRWWFLTEDDPGEMDGIVRDFKIALQKGESPENEPPDITHGTSLLLVDAQGTVRAVFRSSDPEVVEQVEQAVRELTGE